MNRKLLVQYEFPHNEWFLTHYFHSVAKTLVDKNPEIEFSFINSGDLGERNSYTRNSAHMMTITNTDNGKYILQSFWDKNICLFNKHDWDPPNMVQLFCSSGLNRAEYDYFFTHTPCNNTVPIDYDNVVTPFTYFPYTVRATRIIEELYPQRNSEHLDDKMVFRGALYNERLFLRNTIHNEVDIVVDNIQDSYKDAPEFLKEHIGNLCALSINGAAEICNRDIELFGLGMPVLRPELNIAFHNPLIPDVHYIAAGKCDFRCSTTHTDYNILKNAILEKFNFAKSHRDFCLQVGENARKWYLENCTIGNMVSMFEKLVKLDKLF